MDNNEAYKNYLERKLSEIFESQSGKKHLNSLNQLIQLTIKHGNLYETNDGYFYIKVYPDNKKRFINPLGEDSDLFDEIYDFREGYARVYLKGKGNNFINEEGNLISEKWFEEAYDFREGYARVYTEGKGYNFINEEGNLISEKWFDYAFDFNEGYARVIIDSLYHYISGNGKFIGKRYDEAYDFHNGLALVEYYGSVPRVGKTIGSLYSPKMNYLYWDKKYGYNFLTRNGKKLVDELCQNAIVYDGIAYIEFLWWDCYPTYRDEYFHEIHNYKGWIDNEGNKVEKPNLVGDLHTKCDTYYKSKNGLYYIAEKNGKFNIANLDGKLISGTWFDEIKEIESRNGNCYFLVKNNGVKYNIIDLNGNLQFKKWFFGDTIISYNRNFIFMSDDVHQGAVCRSIEMKDYKVQKTTLGYECSSENDSYKVKYKPIKKYGNRYTLCIDGMNVYLYDRNNNSYKELGVCDYIIYDDNFIFDKTHNKVFLIYEDTFVDITDYYFSNLMDKNDISITSGIKGLCSEEDFSNLEQEKMDKFKKISKVEKENVSQDEMTNGFKSLEDKIKESNLEEKEDILEQIRMHHRVMELSSLKEIPKVRINNIFVKVQDHYEINPIFINFLKYINLSHFDFKDVKINGIDLSGCNLGILFNPQLVYEKNLSGCNFSNIEFPLTTNFTGVNVKGCKFTGRIDYINPSFMDSIYDETTTFNGIPFTDLLDQYNYISPSL